MRQLPFGTAQREVLLKLTSPRRTTLTWSPQDGDALYDGNRALTDALCQGLLRHGYLREELKDGSPIYTLTQAGQDKARELRERGIGNSR